MQKTIAAVSALALLASLGISIPVSADSPNAAVVIRADGGCWGFVPSPTGEPAYWLEGSAHTVATSSGNTSLVCKFDIPAGAEPDRATRASGFPCGTYLGLTNDSRMVASPGGQATMTCKINGKKS